MTLPSVIQVTAVGYFSSSAHSEVQETFLTKFPRVQTIDIHNHHVHFKVEMGWKGIAEKEPN